MPQDELQHLHRVYVYIQYLDKSQTSLLVIQAKSPMLRKHEPQGNILNVSLGHRDEHYNLDKDSDDLMSAKMLGLVHSEKYGPRK